MSSTKVLGKDPQKMSDEELAAEVERLAALRTEVRLAQNEVNAEVEIRQMASNLSGATRDAFIARLQVGGSITPVGAAEESAK